MSDSLYSPVRLGDLDLANRVVMAPMTRDRAGPQDEPTDIMVEYYRQRASAGLIVTEGVQPSPAGKGYWRTPGIHSEVQTAGWKKVNDAVTARGGPRQRGRHSTPRGAAPSCACRPRGIHRRSTCI